VGKEDGGDWQGIGISGGELLTRPGTSASCHAIEEKCNQNLFLPGMMVWPVYAEVPTGM
jgi:hypothetical protein